MPFPCLKPRRSSKVFPAPNASLDVDLVEVRKGRVLRIQHINPRMRNKQLPQAKQIKNSSLPPVELRVPRVNFYGNKCVVADPNANQNNVRNGFKIAASSNFPGPQHKRHIPYEGGKVRSNVLFSGLSKDQKRMLFKMGIRSASALKNIVLFFFHGVGGSSDIWQSQISYFSSLGFEIVAPDLIGHGMSEIPLKKRAYHFREILADVLAIFDRYCKKKNLIIGHSYGCAFTTVLARERARRVWRLIMISGGGPIPLAPEIGIFALPLWIVSCIRPCLDQVFEKSAFKTKQKNEMLKRASFNIPSFVLHYVINGQDWPEGDEVYHSWISVPTLLINGRDDTFATLEDAKLMKATIHGSKLEIVDEASHMVMLEAPDKVNKLILEFICSRGSHKLPDVKELAEEGIETPQRSTGNDRQLEPSHGGNEQAPSPETSTHKWTSVHTEATPGYAEEERVEDSEHEEDEEEEEEEEYEEDKDNEDEGEVIITIPSKSSPSQKDVNNIGNTARYRCKLKKGVVTGYDNASYDFEESEGGFYIYRDQYGQSHYVSAEEFHELFDKSNKQTNRTDETKDVNNIEIRSMTIPSFGDINIFENCKEAYVKESQINDPRATTIGKTKAIDINILPHNLSQNSSKSSNVVRCEGQIEAHALYPNNMSSLDVKCKKSMNKQEVDINSTRNLGSRTVNPHPSVTLALGRKRTDSLDYLGEEELIIITSTKDKENNSMFLKESSHDRETSSINNSSQNSISKKGMLQQIPNKKGGNESDYSSLNNSRSKEVPIKCQSLHSELVQKLNAKLNVQERRHIPEANAGTKKSHSLISEEESVGVPHRGSSFLESRKLMEEHFSKSAFKMRIGGRPVIPPLGAPISQYRSSHASPRTTQEAFTLASNSENAKYSRDSNKRSPSCCGESSVVTSSPSFLQSKKAINEHFSKVGLRNPHLSSPLPEIKHSRNSSDNKTPPVFNSRKKSNDMKLSPSIIQPNNENINIDETESPSKSGLNLTEWVEHHLHTISEIGLPTDSNPQERSPQIRRKMSSTINDKEKKIERQMGLSGWAEKHLKLISDIITPPTTPEKTNSRKSSESSSVDNDDKNTDNRLLLSRWAEKHLKLVSEQTPDIASSKHTPRATLRKVTCSQNENDTNKPLSVSEWAERHARRVSSMATNSPGVATPNAEQIIKESKPEQKNVHSNLSVSEWAERHARRLSSMATNSPDVATPNAEQIIKESKPEQKNVHSNLSVSEWAERHARRLSNMATNSPDVATPNAEPERMEERKFELQDVHRNISLSEWAERHARRISSMNSNSTTSSTLDWPQNNDETNICESTSTIKMAQKNLSIKKWAEKHVSIVSETTSNLNSGSSRNSVEGNSEEPNQHTVSDIENKQKPIIKEMENKQGVSNLTSNLSGEIIHHDSVATKDQLEVEQKIGTNISNNQRFLADIAIADKAEHVSSDGDSNLERHHKTISIENKHDIDTYGVACLPECERNVSRTIDKRSKDEDNSKGNDINDQTEKKELVLQEQKNIPVNKQENVDAVDKSELKPDIHPTEEEIGHMEAKTSKQKLHGTSSTISEICEVTEIPHLSNTDLNRWAEKHFQKILNAHSQSDPQKQTTQIQSTHPIFEDDERRNINTHLSQENTSEITSEKLEIASANNQNEINQNENKPQAKKLKAKSLESESDSSSDMYFESCSEHIPESSSNSQINEFCNQSFDNDTGDIISLADNSLASDMTGSRLVFDDNSNIVDSDTDIYNDQFNTDEINIKQYEPNPILKHESFTNPQSSRSAASKLRSACTQFNPNENIISSSKLQTLDTENSQKLLESGTTEASITNQTVFRLYKNDSNATLTSSHNPNLSLEDVDNLNTTQRKLTLPSECGLDASNSTQSQATSLSGNNFDNTEIIQCQTTLSFREENVIETDNDNNLIDNSEDKSHIR